MIYLIRHGQTAFNAEGRFQGAQDSPLTELGQAQAAAVGRRLGELVGPDCPIVSSPLGRARQTAQIVREEAGLRAEITFDQRLAEITLGSWDGMTDEEIEHVYPGKRAGLSRAEWHFHSPDGESYETFTGRLASWLHEAQASPVPLIAVSHGGCSRILRGLHAGLSKDVFLKLPVPQETIFRLHGGSIEEIACDGAALAPAVRFR
jgi:broad specificity phosphatase PhoE